MKFFGKNNVEDASSITCSTGNATGGLMRDRNSLTIWQSVGSNDATTETVTIIFPTARTIDHICLRNINLETYTVKYWNGAAYADFSTPINTAVNTSTSVLHEFNPVSTLRVQLTATTTIVPNQEKHIGEFLAYLQVIYFNQNHIPEDYNPLFYNKKSEHEKANGGSVLIVEGRQPKWQVTFTWETLPETQVNILYAQKLTLQPMWIMVDELEPLYQYYCNWVSDFAFKKVIAWENTIRCYSGEMELKEV